MLIAGTLITLAMIPYADMTLLSANAFVAIITNTFLSIWVFEERFAWKYDLPGLFLITAGDISVVLIANKEQTEYKGEALLDLLSST